jgi:hypothetical protein
VAYTVDDLTAVNSAISRLMAGERVVQISKGDMMVEYGQAKLQELRDYRSEIIASLKATAGRSSHFRVATSKGL